MSSLDMKINRLDKNNAYTPIVPVSQEIDLFELFSTLFAAKKQIIAVTLLFALCGLAISFIMPKKWTSQAIITQPETSDVIELRRALVTLSLFDVNANADSETLFKLFLKKFDSQNLRERFLEQSPYAKALLKDDVANKHELYRAIVNTSQNFKSVNNNSAKKDDAPPYISWSLSFTAPDAQESQQILDSYVAYVANEVNKDVITSLKEALELKIASEKEHLKLDRVNLETQHRVKLDRLGYSLQVANAAGLKAPVYSNGHDIKDDPDFSVSLGSNGLSEKLKIEQSIKDVAQLDASLQNREKTIQTLQAINLGEIDFKPFQVLMQPSLPLKKEGPGRGLIIVLAAFIGLLLSMGTVLVRDMVASRIRNEDLITLSEKVSC